MYLRITHIIWSSKNETNKIKLHKKGTSTMWVHYWSGGVSVTSVGVWVIIRRFIKSIFKMSLSLSFRTGLCVPTNWKTVSWLLLLLNLILVVVA